MLAVLNAQRELKGKPEEHMYEFKPNSFFSDQFPNMDVVLTIHILSNDVNMVAPFLLVYLSAESICLKKNEILGFLDVIDVGICESSTNTASEPLILDVTPEKSHSIQQPVEGKDVSARCGFKCGNLRQIPGALF